MLETTERAPRQSGQVLLCVHPCQPNMTATPTPHTGTPTHLIGCPCSPVGSDLPAVLLQLLQQVGQLPHKLLLVLVWPQHARRQHGCIALLQDAARAGLCWCGSWGHCRGGMMKR